MPFKSKKQRKWMYANKPEMAKEWEKHTSDNDLPEKASSESIARRIDMALANEKTRARKPRLFDSKLELALEGLSDGSKGVRVPHDVFSATVDELKSLSGWNDINIFYNGSTAEVGLGPSRKHAVDLASIYEKGMAPDELAQAAYQYMLDKDAGEYTQPDYKLADPKQSHFTI